MRKSHALLVGLLAVGAAAVAGYVLWGDGETSPAGMQEKGDRRPPPDEPKPPPGPSRDPESRTGVPGS